MNLNAVNGQADDIGDLIEASGKNIPYVRKTKCFNAFRAQALRAVFRMTNEMSEIFSHWSSHVNSANYDNYANYN